MMRMDRRGFIAGAAGIAGTLALGAPARAARLGAIGLQLYTVRELFAADPVGTLGKVAKLGYREVEYGGGNYDRMDHAMLRRTMDRLKLTAPSIHVPYDSMLGDFSAAVKMARTLGTGTIVVPFLTPEHRTEQGIAAVAANLNRFASQLRGEGIALAYHNHDFEFTTQTGGVTLYDRLVQATDPALVKLELDLYWAIRAGQDAAALIDRLSSRLFAFHVKDMRADKAMCAVGAGTIDFGALFRLPGAAQVRHFYVENDEAPAPYLPDIATSIKTLRALRF